MPHVAGEDHELTGVPINVPVNEPVNARQQWFIAQIIAGKQPDWADLAQQWQVSRAAARRDIADLKARGLIEFVGARKTGFYRLAKRE
jgi:predicted ArsR family transcriptional regulator